MTNTIPNVPRELLERIIQFRWIADDLDVKDCRKKLRALLSAPSPAGVDGEHEAQPEVAENTGSRSMANKLQSQGCTGRTEVDGVAAPDEASDAVDIYAWSTFDGEGGYDLRLYENNETYQAEWLALNGEKYSGWVEPLCRLSDAKAIIDGLRGEVERYRAVLDGAKYPNLDKLLSFSVEDCRFLGETVASMTISVQSERDQQARRIGELEGLLRDSVELIKHGVFEEGYCCCGSSVDSHGLGDGHSPVDALAYHAGQVCERIDAALSAGKEDAK